MAPPAPPVLGVICGMEAEVRTLGPAIGDPRIAIGISGARPAQAEAEARRLLEQGVRMFLSWGLAGGLVSGTDSGTIILGDTLSDGAGRRRDLHVPGDLGLHVGHVAGSDRMLRQPAAKHALHRETGAEMVDMESHRVAAVAMEAGVPLVVVRAISDPVDRALPRLVEMALGPDGRPDVLRICRELIARPWQLPGLLAARRDSAAALCALRQVAPFVINVCLRSARRPD